MLLLAGPFEVRGTSSYTLRLGEHLKEHGVTATIVTPDASAVEPARQSQLEIQEYRHLMVPVLGRGILELLYRDLVEEPPDVIHVQSRTMLKRGALLARRLRRPFVVTVHDCPLPRERFVFDPLYGRKVLAVSEYVQKSVIDTGYVDPQLVEVIHSGVNVSPESEGMLVLDPGHTPVVGTAGPLESVKGLPYFLGAAQQVLKSGRQVEFLVSGAGPEETNLRRLTRELGINDSVTFVPNLKDFSAALAAIDIFCLPSLQQGLGTIMLEAMACGKPVIGTQVGGISAAVRDNETGLIVPPSDSAILANRIIELLDDPLRARSIGESAKMVVRDEFAVEYMVNRTANIYREIVELDSMRESR